MLHLTPTTMKDELKIPFSWKHHQGPIQNHLKAEWAPLLYGWQWELLVVFIPSAYRAIFKSLSSIGRNLTNLENNKSMLLALFFMSDYTLMLCQTPSTSKEAMDFARTVAFSEGKMKRGMRKIINCPVHFLCWNSPVIWAGLLPLETRTGRFFHTENIDFFTEQLVVGVLVSSSV